MPTTILVHTVHITLYPGPRNFKTKIRPWKLVTARPTKKAEMGIAGFKNSWRKMEAAAQDRAWMETSSLWLMLHRERQGTSQVNLGLNEPNMLAMQHQ